MAYILETERLGIRPYMPTDFEPAYEMFSDKETMTYYPAPFSREKVENWLKNNQKHYEKAAIGLWAVIHKKDGRFIGDCGLVPQQINGKPMIELGYHIHKEYWRQGYAFEASRAILKYGRFSIGLTEVISIIDPINIASINTAKKNGFLFWENVFIFDKICEIYKTSLATFNTNSKMPE